MIEGRRREVTLDMSGGDDKGREKGVGGERERCLKEKDQGFGVVRGEEK